MQTITQNIAKEAKNSKGKPKGDKSTHTEWIFLFVEFFLKRHVLEKYPWWSLLTCMFNRNAYALYMHETIYPNHKK